jgi:hypothetical protein
MTLGPCNITIYSKPRGRLTVWYFKCNKHGEYTREFPTKQAAARMAFEHAQNYVTNVTEQSVDKPLL